MVDNTENKVLIREFNEDRDIEVVGKLEKNCEIGSNKGVITSMMGDPLCRIKFYPVHVMLVGEDDSITITTCQIQTYIEPYHNFYLPSNKYSNDLSMFSTFQHGNSLSPKDNIDVDYLESKTTNMLDYGLQVAELHENGELVGVVRGCIKYVGTKFGGTYVKLGCILGLRVSPRHRRMGIGFKLVKSVEEWLMENGAHYTFLATEKNNVASTNLFTTKCSYVNFSSLVIFVQPLNFPLKGMSQDINIEKLQIDQAISLYNNKLKGKDIYPTDMDAILKETLSLGTWVSYFKEEEWIGLHNKEKSENIISRTPRSWVIFSIWNSCEAYKIRIKKSHPLKFFHATLSHAKEKIFPCLKMPISDSLEKPFGFLFLYGLHGEGERLGELMKSIWSYVSQLAENVKDCKVIMTELGVSDPLIEHVPQESCMSCINDLWYLKKVNGLTNDNGELMMMGQVGNVFIDPRDF